MSINKLLPFASTIIIFVFAFLVFRRYTRRKGLHLLVWGIGLVWFGMGSLAEAYSALAWNATLFRLWYLGGAVLNAAWLGQGTVYLLVRRKVGGVRLAHILMAILVVFSVVATIMLFTTPTDASKFTTDLPLSRQYKEILPKGAPVRATTPIFNIYGLVTLAGGAIYSAYLFWRKRILPQRMVGNILIAIGALVIGGASTALRIDLTDFLYLAELLSAILMFIGFLQATASPEAQARLAAATQQA